MPLTVKPDLTDPPEPWQEWGSAGRSELEVLLFSVVCIFCDGCHWKALTYVSELVECLCEVTREVKVEGDAMGEVLWWRGWNEELRSLSMLEVGFGVLVAYLCTCLLRCFL